jgi:hypothetical protein
MKRRVSIAAAALLIVAFAPARRAAARDRLAVLVASEADQRLGDNLTDVALAAAAEASGDELVGALELRAKMAASNPTADLAACAEDLGCVVEIARAVGAARALVGTVHRSPDSGRIRFSLVDVRSGTEEAATARETAGGIPALIDAVQSGVRGLLVPAPPPVPPPPQQPAGPALAAARLAPPSFAPVVSATPPPARTATGRGRARLTVAYGAAGLALASFATAIVTGTIGSSDPTGATRVDAEHDLERRHGYVRVANGCWLAGGALSVIGAAAFLWRW